MNKDEYIDKLVEDYYEDNEPMGATDWWSISLGVLCLVGIAIIAYIIKV